MRAGVKSLAVVEVCFQVHSYTMHYTCARCADVEVERMVWYSPLAYAPCSVAPLYELRK